MAKRLRKSSHFEKQKLRKQQLDDGVHTNWASLAGTEEVDLENEPRFFKTLDDSDDDGLPVIKDGKVTRTKRQQPVAQAPQEAEDSSEAESDPEAAEPLETNEADQLNDSQLKEKIAEYAMLINEEPEDHMAKLGELQMMATKTKKARARQVLILSLLRIFKDLIPGYSIKQLSEAQMKEKVSKEIRKQRDAEQALITHYGSYVKLLEKSFKDGKTASANSGRHAVSHVALQATCELLESAPWFNYRMDLIKILIDRLSSQKIDRSFERCVDCVVTLFENDYEGHISLEIVQGLQKMIKLRRYKVDSRVLATLTHLRLLTELVGRADLERMIKEKPAAVHIPKKQKVYFTKKQRKQRKEQKEIDEEMRKAETAVSAEMREKLQAQTLKIVFVIYINVLKERSKSLMSTTLEGLAKYAFLINANLFGDLLEVLRQIINEQQQIDTRQSLLCIVTAFALLREQAGGDSMNLDLTFFINRLYEILTTMAFDPQVEQSHRSLQSAHRGKLASETDLFVRSMEALLLDRHFNTRPRVLAFCKRLASCALMFPQRSALICLGIITKMNVKFPFSKALLSTQDRVSKGIYHWDSEVPERANAEVATIWETVLLSQHYDPAVAKAAKALSRTQEQ